MKRDQDRSRSPAVRFRDGKNHTGLEGFVTFGSQADSDYGSSPMASSSPAAPVKTNVPKNWADMVDQDEDALWDIITNQPLEESTKENKASGTQAEVMPEDDEEDTLVATPQKTARSLRKTITVQDLLQTAVESPQIIASDPVLDVFKTPCTSSARRISRDKTEKHYRHQHHHREERGYRQHRSERIFSKSSQVPLEMESDSDTLRRRQKAIDFGKNTIGYQNYIQMVSRVNRTKVDPQTPDKFIKFSRRSWDQQIKIWRQKLHAYDPNDGENDLEMDISEIMSDLSVDSKVTSTGCSSPVSSSYPTSSPLEDDVSDEDFASDQVIESSDFASESETGTQGEDALDLLAELDESEFIQS